ALAGGGEEDLGRRRVGVLLEEVVLDLPDVLDAEAVGVLDLVERVGDELLLAALGPRPRQLVLVEQAELHGVPLTSAPRLGACLGGPDRPSGPPPELRRRKYPPESGGYFLR